MRKGDSVEVIDVSKPTGPKKLPFAKGAQFRVAKIWSGGGVEVEGVVGIWQPHRFKVVDRG